MIQIKIIRTGNYGNCYLLTTDTPKFSNLPKSIMIDCGGNKLENIPRDIGCICITHSHSDHINALGWLLHDLDYKPIIVIGDGEYDTPIAQNLLGLRYGLSPNVLRIKHGQSFCVGNFVVRACLAHHDTDYPVHYFISDGSQCVFVGCDTNELSDEALNLISQSDGVIIEANYSESILNDISSGHRERLTSYGHLSNAQIAEIKPYLEHAKRVCLVHINEEMNTEELIKKEVDWDAKYTICMPNKCPIQLNLFKIVLR